jgi:integrase
VKLNSNQIKSLKEGVYADGNGLYLLVRENRRVWQFRFTDPDGKRAAMEFARIGDKPGELSLTEARDQARAYRLALKKDGIDPRHRRQRAQHGDKTFLTFAEEQYPAWCEGLSSEEQKQWARSIADLPSLHHRKLHEITTEHVLAALKPIWSKKPITAMRTRQRVERLLDAAKALKLRVGENPAMWRGNLKHLLPSPRKLNRQKTKGGHASIPYDKTPALMIALQDDPAVVARCVEVGILTVTRSQEIRLMEWTEIDFDKRTWLIPAAKMKIKGETKPKPHLVPLSDQAIEIIRSMSRVGKFVFPSDHADEHQPFRPNALVNAIKRAGFNATMHGNRTSFRNWGADSVEHNFRREVLEFCLSHRLGDEAELAYWNSDMIARRRVALQAWADYIRPKRAKDGSKRGRLTLVA